MIAFLLAARAAAAETPLLPDLNAHLRPGVSTPLKILLFVMVDGWNLLAHSLLKSF